MTLDTLRLAIQILDSAACLLANNGRIQITAQGGTPFSDGSYRYHLNGGQQNVFTSPITINNIRGGDYNLYIRDSLGCTTLNTINFQMPYGENPEGNAVDSDISCNGLQDGSVIITGMPSGNYGFLSLNGFPNVTGSVSGNTFTAQNLIEGNYAIIVRNSFNCADTVFFDITEPEPIVLNAVVTQADCNQSGSIILKPTGGVGQ